MIGRVVIGSDGRRLGRVIAVIHKNDGVDALVEGRRWLLHRGYRFDADDLTWTDAGRLLVTTSIRGPRDATRAIGIGKVSGGKGR